MRISLRYNSICPNVLISISIHIYVVFCKRLCYNLLQHVNCCSRFETKKLHKEKCGLIMNSILDIIVAITAVIALIQPWIIYLTKKLIFNPKIIIHPINNKIDLTFFEKDLS